MREYVMAILCSPVTANELQLAEKNNSVFIVRKLDFGEYIYSYSNEQQFFDEHENSPFKLMFFFDNNETIVVRNAADKQEVMKKLAAVPA